MDAAEEAVYFETPEAFRKWLEANGTSADVLWVGYHKVATGKPSMTWEESVDEALCYGWIDGLRKSVDADRYRIRFTPRRLTSNWSAKNLRRIKELEQSGRLRPEGLAVYTERKRIHSRAAVNHPVPDQLDQASLAALRQNTPAWQFFQHLAPSYKRLSIRWVMTAKREKTRQDRLQILIQSSANGEKIPLLQR